MGLPLTLRCWPGVTLMSRKEAGRRAEVEGVKPGGVCAATRLFMRGIKARLESFVEGILAKFVGFLMNMFLKTDDQETEA